MKIEIDRSVIIENNTYSIVFVPVRGSVIYSNWVRYSDEWTKLPYVDNVISIAKGVDRK